MKIHSTPNNWHFLSEQRILEKNLDHSLFKNNPDVQWAPNFQGYWIRPGSKIGTYLILKEVEFGSYRFKNTPPNWRDHD